MSQPGKILTARGMTFPQSLSHLRVPLWGLIALAAALVCLGGFAAHGFDENGLPGNGFAAPGKSATSWSGDFAPASAFISPA